MFITFQEPTAKIIIKIYRQKNGSPSIFSICSFLPSRTGNLKPSGI